MIAADLGNIRTYMRVDPCNNHYRQICELQGFFLQSGGFLVADIPVVKDFLGLVGICFHGEPTTSQVLEALDTMIKQFNLSPSQTKHAF